MKKIDWEKIDKAEPEVLDILKKYDIQYAEATYLFMQLISFTCVDSGFPFEKFQRLVNEVASDFKASWPIG